MDSFPAFLAMVLGGITLLVLLIMTIMIFSSRHFNKINCEQFSRQAHRATKFVIYNRFSMGECLTPSGHGTWIPTANLREFGDRSPVNP